MSSLYLQLHLNRDEKKEDVLQLYMYVHRTYMAAFSDYQKVATLWFVQYRKEYICRKSISPVGDHTLVERRCQQYSGNGMAIFLSYPADCGAVVGKSRPNT